MSINKFDWFTLSAVTIWLWVVGTFLYWGALVGKERCYYITVVSVGILITWCYLRTVFTHPGKVPMAWRENPISLSPLISGTRRRWCAKCASWKPPRSHHCSVCQTCILKYDHHCPWIANCVGFFNHKSFLLLIIYSALLDWFLVLSCFDSVNSCLVEGQVGGWCSTGIAVTNFYFAYFTAGTLGILLTIFGSHHLSLTAKNCTTVESLDLCGYNMYQRSIFQNYKEAMGEDVVMWLLPTVPKHTSSGELGVNFSVNPSLQSSVTPIVPHPQRINLNSQSHYGTMDHCSLSAHSFESTPGPRTPEARIPPPVRVTIDA